MSKTIPKTLTSNGITKLFESSAESQSVIVQLTSIVPKETFYFCTVSDGSFNIRAIIPLELTLHSEKDLYCVIKIKSHQTNSKGIVVGSFDKLKEQNKQIGNPIDFFHARENNISNPCSNVIDMDVKNQNKQNTQKKLKKEQQSAPTQQLNNNLREDYNSNCNQTISTLYVGISNWMIVCRILKCDYRQYQNKKKTLTKQLNLQLIDRSKMKINGRFFGEAAIKFKEFLKENAVYQISKGRVVEGNYNDSKNKLYSPYEILFNENSDFNQISDVNLIAKSQNLVTDLGTVVENRLFNHELDIAAILLEIRDQIQISKKDNSGMLRKRNVVVCDPQKEISMFATLWNDNVNINPSLVGKTVLLSHFKLNEYLQSLSLNSTPKSDIRAMSTHRYSKYEGKINTQNYDMISMNRKQNEVDSGQICRNVKQLEGRVMVMSVGEIIKSELDVFVSRLATYRKWNYDGCNRCSKGLQPMSKCQKCNIIVEVPSPHFSIGVQFSDAFGSFWTTALDQLGLRIFDANINHLKKLNEDQLANEADKYLYKQFKLKIKTIKDQENRVKHQVIRINELSFNKIAKNTLEVIKAKI